MDAPWVKVYQYIQDDVDRPDMEDVIKRRIQRELLNAHRIEFFAKDLNETELHFQTNVNIQQIDLTLYPGFRRVCYIRQFLPPQVGNPLLSVINGIDNQDGSSWPGDFDEVSLTKMVDSYGYDRDRVYYQSGAQINLRSASAFDTLWWGYFKDPRTEPLEECQDWMLINYAELIAQQVVQVVFRNIGKIQERQLTKQDSTPLQIALLTNEKTIQLKNP